MYGYQNGARMIIETLIIETLLMKLTGHVTDHYGNLEPIPTS